MKKINIMTSCDNNLAEYIMPQLASIHVNMPDYDIHFYLFHYRISEEKIKLLSEYIKLLENITFHEIFMQNISEFEILAKHGGRFPPEAYVYLYCHDQLPLDMERILYIDAGDVIIHGDISEYYFDDFEDMSFIVTPNAFAVLEDDGSLRLFDEGDLDKTEHVKVLRATHVSSGCIVLNLNKLRDIGAGLLQKYIKIAEKVYNMGIEWVQDIEGCAYLGDQGIMGLAFVGDMKFYGYREIMKKVMHSWPAFTTRNHIQNMYLPYNFAQGYLNFNDALESLPVVLHYGSPSPKPWVRRYTEEDIGNPDLEKEMAGLGHLHVQMHKIWWEYRSLTPLAESDSKDFGLNLDARDKNFSKINPLQYMASWHLAYSRYDDALKFIERALEIAATDSNSFHSLWQLKVRAFMENKKDAARYEKTLAVIAKYFSQTERPSYMRVFMLYYKGYCFHQTQDYNTAILSYMESESLMKGYEHGLVEADSLLLFPIDPTIDSELDWVELCEKGEMYYPVINDGETPRRKFRVRIPLPNSENARRISECYICLGDFTEAFMWARRIVFSQGNDVRNYFRLMNESGQVDRVGELFGKITALRNRPASRLAMDECFVAFDEIVLSHPLAADIIAPFFDEYIEHAHEYMERAEDETEDETPCPTHIMAQNLRISDKMFVEGDKKTAFEHFKKAWEADARFRPLMAGRLDKFNE